MIAIPRRTLHIVLCLLLLYISWGSAYLGNKVALEYFPGFMLSGIRFSLAGLLLLAYTYLRREKSTFTWHDIKYNLLNGFYLVTISSGFVSKAQESVPSGMAAILYGAAPIWLILGQWLLWGGKSPTKTQTTGLILGFLSLAWLNIHQGIHSDASILGLFLIFISTFAWVYGSHISQVCHGKSNLSVMRTTGLLLFLGGLETLLLSLVLGERLDIFTLPLQAYTSLAFLTFFSSLVGYTSYLWLLFNSRAIVAISYEYVTPVVAIALGALLGNELLTLTMVTASMTLMLSVFLITTHDKE